MWIRPVLLKENALLQGLFALQIPCSLNSFLNHPALMSTRFLERKRHSSSSSAAGRITRALLGDLIEIKNWDYVEMEELSSSSAGKQDSGKFTLKMSFHQQWVKCQSYCGVFFTTWGHSGLESPKHFHVSNQEAEYSLLNIFKLLIDPLISIQVSTFLFISEKVHFLHSWFQSCPGMVLAQCNTIQFKPLPGHKQDKNQCSQELKKDSCHHLTINPEPDRSDRCKANREKQMAEESEGGRRDCMPLTVTFPVFFYAQTLGKALREISPAHIALHKQGQEDWEKEHNHQHGVLEQEMAAWAGMVTGRTRGHFATLPPPMLKLWRANVKHEGIGESAISCATHYYE